MVQQYREIRSSVFREDGVDARKGFGSSKPCNYYACKSLDQNG